MGADRQNAAQEKRQNGRGRSLEMRVRVTLPRGEILRKLRRKKAVGARTDEKGWKCSCGTLNKGKFCHNCGAKKPAGAPL